MAGMRGHASNDPQLPVRQLPDTRDCASNNCSIAPDRSLGSLPCPGQLQGMVIQCCHMCLVPSRQRHSPTRGRLFVRVSPSCGVPPAGLAQGNGPCAGSAAWPLRCSCGQAPPGCEADTRFRAVPAPVPPSCPRPSQGARVTLRYVAGVLLVCLLFGWSNLPRPCSIGLGTFSGELASLTRWSGMREPPLRRPCSTGLAVQLTWSPDISPSHRSSSYAAHPVLLAALHSQLEPPTCWSGMRKWPLRRLCSTGLAVRETQLCRRSRCWEAAKRCR